MYDKHRRELVLENYVCPTVFFMYTLTGHWRPGHWTGIKKWAYKVYTTFVFCLMISMCFGEIIYVFFTTNITQTLSGDCAQFLARLHTTLRILAITYKREAIYDLIRSCIDERWCGTQDKVEVAILHKTKHRTRLLTITFLCVAISCAASIFIRRIVDEGSIMQLPINMWNILDVEKPRNFWYTYIFQMVTTTAFIPTYAANACMVVAFMINVNTQLDILKYRIANLQITLQSKVDNEKTMREVMQMEKRMITNCIRDHKCILRYTQSLNATFGWMQFFLFFMATFEICTSVLKLAAHNIISVEFYLAVTYLLLSVTQIFMYSWVGNEIIVNSLSLADTIASVDWLSMRVGIRKMFLIMMTCLARPMVISCGPIFTWNISCFINVMKTSYSVLNLLKHSTQ